jgi:chromosome segregation ATPase
VERLGKAKERDERRLVVEEAERTMKRHQGALKRIQIEWRNIEARAAKTAGADIPNELDAKLDALDEQQIHAKANLDSAIKQFKELRKQLADADNEVRVAVAHVQRAEGKKEGLLIAYEGDIAERSRALDRALFEKLQELADAGRAIIDLRGQVPVDPSVRSDLLAADGRVMEAARHLEIVRRAVGSMDTDAFGTGRAIWIAGVLALIILLIVSTL